MSLPADPLAAVRPADPSPALRARVLALQASRDAPRPKPLWPWLVGLALWLVLLGQIHARFATVEFPSAPATRSTAGRHPLAPLDVRRPAPDSWAALRSNTPLELLP